MRQTSKLLSLLLALVLCLGLLPATAMAEDLSRIEVITDATGPSITLNANGGKFADGSTVKRISFLDLRNLGAGSGARRLIGEIEEPTWDGHEFTGWMSVGGPLLSSAELAEDSATYYSAQWDPSGDSSGEAAGPFTITFDANGGTFYERGKELSVKTVQTTLVNGKHVVSLDKTPEWSGHKLLGWKNSDGVLVNFSEGFQQDTTLTAEWEALDPYTITLDANGGKFADGSATKKITTHWNFSYCLPDDESQMPTWAGHTFVGWEYKGSISTSYHDKYDEDRTYKAVWDGGSATPSNGIRIDFDPNGGTISSIRAFAASEIYAGSTLAQQNGIFVDKNSGRGMMTTDAAGKLDSLPVVGREGYTFDGWYDGSTKVTKDTVFNSPANLTAKWTKADGNTCTVTFNLNGYTGVALPAPITVKKGETIQNLPKLEIPGEKTFPGWGYANADGKTLTEWKSTDKVSQDLTLYVLRYVEGTKKTTLTTPSTSSTPSTPAGSSKPSGSSKPAFSDVPATSPFAPAIAWAVEQGITNGTTPTTFSPGTTCSTGHILTFLWRANGSPEPTIQNPYKDEIPNAFKKAAIWAHEKGLVSGDTFGSATPCTRAASVTYMWKLAGSPKAKAASFKDVPASSSYAGAVAWAVEQGVTKGTSATTFAPENICTRGQIVTFLYRAYAG